MAKRRTTLKDVAREAGVTISTVSRVLNHKTLTVPVTDSTKERVFEAARTLHYIPNRLARGLAAATTHVAGMSFPMTSPLNRADHRDVTFLNLGMLISGVQNVFQASGYELHIFNRLEHDLNPDAPPRRMSLDFIDGLIYVEPNPKYPYFEEVVKAGLPCVLLGENPMEHPVHSVCADDFEEMRRLVSALIRKGHRRIGYLLALLNEPPMDVLKRMEGYCAAHRDAEIDVDYELIRREHVADVPLRDSLTALLSREPSITALLIGRPEVAVDVLGMVQEAGYRVPEDIEIVVVGDDRFFAATQPSLSAMRFDYLRIGAEAAHLLLDAVRGEVDEATSISVPWGFMERESCRLRECLQDLPLVRPEPKGQSVSDRANTRD